MKKLLVLFVVLMLAVGCQPKPVIEDCSMAIEIALSDTNMVTFAANSVVDNLDEKTIIYVVESFGPGGGSAQVAISKFGDTEGWFSALRDGGAAGTRRVDYTQQFSVNNGQWYTPNSSYSDDTPFHAAVTYDRTSDLNVPIIYVEGVAQSLNTLSVPSGTAGDESGQQLIIGNIDNAVDGTGLFPLGGIVYKILIYDRILTPVEIKEDFDSKMFITNFNGLVWACAFHGAAGLQVYEGASLAGANTFREFINGSIGTPANTPAGVGDTVLHNGHLQWQEGRGGS